MTETTSYLGNSFNYNGPRYSGNVNVSLDRGNFTWFYGVDMIGAASDRNKNDGTDVFANSKYADLPNGIGSSDCSGPDNYCVRYKLTTNFYQIHSASLRYRGEGWNMTVGVQNLWDQHPPTVGAGMFRNGNAALNAYDMRGRRVSLRFGKTF